MKHILQRIGSVVLLAMIIPGLATAATFLDGKTILGGISTSINDDVYVAGNQISTLPGARINGDLVTATGQITISGPVSGDIIAASGNATIEGMVGDDVRLAAGTATIGSTIRGDLLLAAGQATLLPSVQVLGDAYVSGGQISASGEYSGAVELAGDDVLFDGSSAGDVRINGKTIVIGDNAIFAGNLTYPDSAEITISDLALIRGELIAEDMTPHNKGDLMAAFIGVFTLLQFAKMIGLMVIAVLLVTVLVKLSRKVTKTALDNPWKSLAAAVGTMILTPLAAIVLFGTIIGIPLAILLLILVFAIMMIGGVYAGVVLGTWLRQVFTKEKTPHWGWSLLGVFGLFILLFIPIVGWLLLLAVCWISTGSVLLLLYREIWKKRV